jgi:hypothetical protein
MLRREWRKTRVAFPKKSRIAEIVEEVK